MAAALVGTVCNSAPFAIVNAKLTNAEVLGDTRLVCHHCLVLSTQVQIMIAHMPVAVLETRAGNCISHVAGDMN